jgi:hypothetical protein
MEEPPFEELPLKELPLPESLPPAAQAANPNANAKMTNPVPIFPNFIISFPVILFFCVP